MAEQLSENHIPIKRKSGFIKSICFYSFDYQDALSRLRLIGPAQHLGLEVVRGVENGQVLVGRAQLGDVIVLQRDFPRAIEEYEGILSQAHQRHIPVVLDIDDLLFELPEDHPDRIMHTYAGNLLPTFQAMLEADLVTVTTTRLRDFVRDYNKQVIVLPNYLDDQIWKLKPAVYRTNPGDKIVLGYMGGHTHSPDLAMLVQVIKVLTGLYPERLEFHFWGAEPPHELSTNRCVHWHDQIFWNYQDFAVFFQAQPIDILFAPLADNRFNNCKSSIKYLEYASLGVPGVYSKVAPYASVIKHGENGLLASTAEEWLDCLTRLIENPKLRYSLAANATADIRSRWLLSKKASMWLSAYKKALKFAKSKAVEDSPTLRMVRNLSRQNVSWNRDAKLQMDEQKKKIIELEDLVAQRDATLSGITNSQTWKLALLLRKIRTKIYPPRSR